MMRTGPLFFSPLSAVYSAITRTRLHLYKRGTFRTEKLPAPVISIGNITTGGTGKTPLVAWIASTLAAEGRKVCVLTRGYGRAAPNERVLVSDGQKVLQQAPESGDEPFLLATQLVGKAAVISDANRFAAGLGAIRHLGTNTFVLDDGFQHLRLARDLDIVTIDATNPWGGGRVLPSGHLREPLSGLKRANCFVITRVDQVENVRSVTDRLNELTDGTPTFLSRMQTTAVDHLTSARAMDQSVFAFSGIGNPASFLKQLEAQPFAVVGSRSFPDHHRYTQSDLASLTQAAQRSGAAALITTEKDAVKLGTLEMSMACKVLKISIEVENSERLKELLIAAGQ